MRAKVFVWLGVDPAVTTWVVAAGVLALHVQSVDAVVRHFFL